MTLERPRNIDLFNDVAAEVFREFYERFPVTSEIDDLALRTKVFDGVAIGDDEAEEFVEESIEWLVLSGYIHEDKQGYKVLTMKGLEVLKSTPDSLSEPLGDRLKTAGAGAGKHILRGVVDQILSAGVEIMMKGGPPKT